MVKKTAGQANQLDSFTETLYVKTFYSVVSMGPSSDGAYVCVTQATDFEPFYC